METVPKLMDTHPEMVQAIKNLVLFDAKVYMDIDNKYGSKTLDSIIKRNDYHKEIDNVNNGITTDTRLNRIAQRREAIFDKYSEETGKVARVAGFKETMEMIDIISKYYKEMAFMLV